MSEFKSLYEYVSEVTELNDMSEYMQDSTLDEALGNVVKLTQRTDVPPAVVARLIVQLQAMSAKFKLQAKYYVIFDNDKENKQRKEVYFTAAEVLQGVVDGLKYIVKYT